MQQLRAHGRRLDVGLGWFRQTRERGDAEPFVEHLGGGAGYFSMMRLYPRRGVGILTMGNATRYDHAAIATRVAALAA